MGAIARIMTVSAVALGLSACASSPGPLTIENSQRTGHGVRVEIPSHPLECVPYARAQSGIPIHGDAWTWWGQAKGRYRRTHRPEPGAVMVFSRDGGPAGGHVAVVRSLVSPREIRVDHANWLGQGRIYLGNPVVDVSPDNDWSRVRVWNVETGAWGGHAYPISGFIERGIGPVASAAPDS